MSGLYFFVIYCLVMCLVCCVDGLGGVFFLVFLVFFVLCIKIIAQKFVCYQELIYLCIAIENCNVLDV